jgi:serine/threonine-protein kinase RsbW
MSRERYTELDVTVAATAGHLGELRDIVRSFGQDCDMPGEAIDAMVLAAHEACANVCVHAYGEEGGPLHLRGWRLGDGLALEVSDHGTPVAKPKPGRLGGLGLGIIRELSDGVDIEGPGPYGTRLAMTFKRPSGRGDGASS